MDKTLPQSLVKENNLLASLSEEDYERIRHHSKIIHLAADDNFYNCGDSISHVYFPLDAVAHLVTTMENGAMAEVGIVGFEGIVGISALMGVKTMPTQVFVINPSRVLRIKAEILKRLFDEGGTLNKLLLRYMHAFYIQTSQIVACNRVHYLEERLCRWLLMSQDRFKGRELLVTQEFISQMLATRRPYITTTLGNLQRANAIFISRKSIEILDRRILEKCACECYGIITNEFIRLEHDCDSANNRKD